MKTTHSASALFIFAALLTGAWLQSTHAESVSAEEAAVALKRASRFMRESVATNGGYLWRYSADLSQRWGEGKATATQVWVQPPGTPTVGQAFLLAYQRTDDTYYLDAAREAAHALVFGQMETGGWDYLIDFAPPDRRSLYYRHDAQAGRSKPPVARAQTVFDDDNSQSALRFLMQYDRATGFADSKVGDTIRYALDHFLKAQYPNGAWPQRFQGPADPRECPVKRAEYPLAVSYQYPAPKPPYHRYYTLNDHVMRDMIRTMLLAYEIHGRKDCLAAARRGGDFLLLAQMPEPQPAWAQQYDLNMHPAWARRFEPPAIATVESLSALTALMDVYVATGDSKYLEPVPKTLAWFDRVRRPDGRHTRFYELKTDRPIYFNRKYELVYTDEDMPTHYAFVLDLNHEGQRERFAHLEHERRQYMDHRHTTQVPRVNTPHPSQVRDIIHQLDDQGRWIEEDMIRCDTFARNASILSNYLAEKHKNE